MLIEPQLAATEDAADGMFFGSRWGMPWSFYATIKDTAAALHDESATPEQRIKGAQMALLTLLSSLLSKREHSHRTTMMHGSLTPRESAVLQQIGQGQSNKRIARILGIAPETVKSHAKRIMEKLNAQTRAEAVAVAAEFNLL